MEGDDKIAVLLGAGRSVQSVVGHPVAHSGEAAAVLFQEVDRRKGFMNYPGINGRQARLAICEEFSILRPRLDAPSRFRASVLPKH
jgi:hypothetical protein